MFFLYAAGLIILSLALMATLLESLRSRSSWLGGLTLFLGILVFQLLISSFESATFRATLPMWSIGPLEENLAFFNFALYVIPLMVILNLAEGKSPWSPSLLTAAGMIILAFSVSLFRPGFWKSPVPDGLTLLGFSAFLSSLGIYLFRLITSLIFWGKSNRKPAGLGYLLWVLLFRFILETLANLLHPLFPPGAAEYIPPVSALILGSGLSILFLRKLTAPWLDPRPVTPAQRVFEEWDLSPRESEVAVQLCRGLNTGEIGGVLFISEKTVNSHLTNIFRKAGVKSRTQLLTRLRQMENPPSQ